MSFTERTLEKIKRFLREKILDIFFIILIVGSLLYFSLLLRNPFDKLLGDDIQKWVFLAKFLANNFPLLYWDPHGYTGYNPFLVLGPFHQIVIVIISKLASIQVYNAFQIYFFLTVALTGIIIYILCRELGCTHYLSYGLSILWYSTQQFWGIAIFGGAYQRVFTLPFVFLVILLAFRHIKRINLDQFWSKETFIFLFIISLSISLNLFIMLYGFIVIAFLYLFGVKWTREKIINFLVECILIVLLSVWYLLPFFATGTTILGGVNNNPLILRLSMLFPASYDGYDNLNLLYPILFTLSIIYLVMLIFISSKNLKREKFAFILSALILSIYALVYGWTGISIFVIKLHSGSDSAFPLMIGIILFTASVFSCQLKLPKSHQKNKNPIHHNLLSIAFILLVVINAQLFLPKMAVIDPAPIGNELEKVIDNYVEITGNLNDYRLGGSQRFIGRWINFAHPDIMSAGTRVASPLYPYTFYWFSSSVLYRSDLFEPHLYFNYFEDIPSIIRENNDTIPNYYIPLWWMDWYAVNSIVLLPQSLGYYQFKTLEDYSLRPQFFKTNTISSNVGDLNLIYNLNSAPIAIGTNATRLGYVGSLEGYYNLLEILSYMNLNSRYIIPVYLNEINQINTIDALIVEKSKSKYINLPQDTRVKRIDMDLEDPKKYGIIGSFNLAKTILSKDYFNEIRPQSLENMSHIYFINNPKTTISYKLNAIGDIASINGRFKLNFIPDRIKGHKQINYLFELPQDVLVESGNISLTIKTNYPQFGIIFEYMKDGQTMNFKHYDITDFPINKWQQINISLNKFRYENNSLDNMFSKSNRLVIVIGQDDMSTEKKEIELESIKIENQMTKFNFENFRINSTGLVLIDNTSMNVNDETVMLGYNSNLLFSGKFNNSALPLSSFKKINSGINTNTINEIYISTRYNPIKMNNAPLKVVLLKEPMYEDLEGKWVTNTRYIIDTGDESKYRSIVTKITYTTDIKIKDIATGENIDYSMAGPYLIMIPLVNKITDNGLEIKIEEPRSWYYGSIISFVTFILCIGYLFYDWKGYKIRSLANNIAFSSLFMKIKRGK